MAKYLIKYGIPEEVHFEKEVEAINEHYAQVEADTLAISLTYSSVERIDPMSDDEVVLMAINIFQLFSDLPSDKRKAVLESLQRLASRMGG